MIFISHSSEDFKLIDLLNQFLNSIGVKREDIFCSSFEGQGVKNGLRIADNVLEKLNQSNIVIYVITNNFLQSVYCTQELGIGWASKRDGLFIFKLEDVDPNEIKGFVSNVYKYSNLDSSGMSALCDRLDDLDYKISKKHTIINDSINAFLNSAKSIVSILVETKDLTKEETDRAIVENLQKQYKVLAPGAKAIITELYFSYNGVNYYSIQDGVVGSLADKSFIRRTTSVSIGFHRFGYELQPWVVEFINSNDEVKKELEEIDNNKYKQQISKSY